MNGIQLVQDCGVSDRACFRVVGPQSQRVVDLPSIPCRAEPGATTSNNTTSQGIADDKASIIQVCDDGSGNDTYSVIAASSAEFPTIHYAVGRWLNDTYVDTSSYAEPRDLEVTVVAFI